MSGATGFVIPAATVGLASLVIRPKLRGFQPYNADGSKQSMTIPQAVLSEVHRDTIRITEHPVEQGAAIADHAYKMPAEVVIRAVWSNSPSGSSGIVSQAVALGTALSKNVVVGVAASLPATITAVGSILNNTGLDSVSSIYADLLDLQISRVPFDIFTGKRVYRSMLLETIEEETNSKTENLLILTLHCKQVIIVQTQVVTLSADVQANPQSTAGEVDRGVQNMQQATAAGALL